MFSAASRSILRRTAVAVRRQQQTTRKMGSDMPVPQSQNAPLWNGHTVKHEGWEEYIYFYYFVGLVLQAAVVFGAPEFAFGTHYQELIKNEQVELWDKFNGKAMNPGDDDDDDDDDEDEDDDEEGEEVCGKWF
jgi:hypothetical protein